MAQIKQQANIGSLKHDQIEVLEKEKKKEDSFWEWQL